MEIEIDRPASGSLAKMVCPAIMQLSFQNAGNPTP